MLRLQRLDLYDGPIQPSNWGVARRALDRFIRMVGSLGWISAEDREQVLLLLFDHYRLAAMQREVGDRRLLPFSASDDDKDAFLDSLATLDDDLLALPPDGGDDGSGDAVLEGEIAFVEEEILAFGGAEAPLDPPEVAFAIIAQLADQDPSRLEGAIRECQVKPHQRGLRDGIRKAFRRLRRWGGRLLDKLKAGARAGRTTLREAARVLHGWSSSALSAIRGACTTMLDFLLGNIHASPHALVKVQRDLDISVMVDRRATLHEIHEARQDLQAFAHRFRTSTVLLSLVMDLLLALTTGIGWLSFLVRLAERWREILQDGVLGFAGAVARREGGGLGVGGCA